MQYARELEEAAGAPDPEIQAKIALLQQTIQARDSVVQETVDKMENGGIAEQLQLLEAMEHEVRAWLRISVTRA